MSDYELSTLTGTIRYHSASEGSLPRELHEHSRLTHILGERRNMGSLIKDHGEIFVGRLTKKYDKGERR